MHMQTTPLQPVAFQPTHRLLQTHRPQNRLLLFRLCVPTLLQTHRPKNRPLLFRLCCSAQWTTTAYTTWFPPPSSFTDCWLVLKMYLQSCASKHHISASFTYVTTGYNACQPCSLSGAHNSHLEPAVQQHLAVNPNTLL
jgi:hypothetical protein